MFVQVCAVCLLIEVPQKDSIAKINLKSAWSWCSVVMHNTTSMLAISSLSAQQHRTLCRTSSGKQPQNDRNNCVAAVEQSPQKWQKCFTEPQKMHGRNKQKSSYTVDKYAVLKFASCLVPTTGIHNRKFLIS
jgi:hypothetical protein